MGGLSLSREFHKHLKYLKKMGYVDEGFREGAGLTGIRLIWLLELESVKIFKQSIRSTFMRVSGEDAKVEGCVGKQTNNSTSISLCNGEAIRKKVVK